MTDNTAEHTTLVNATLIAITALPEAMFYPNASGVGRTARGAFIRAGVPGGGDIMGTKSGHAVAIECKTGVGRPNPNQIRFRASWEKAKGKYFIVRSVDDALSALAALQ